MADRGDCSADILVIPNPRDCLANQGTVSGMHKVYARSQSLIQHTGLQK